MTRRSPSQRKNTTDSNTSLSSNNIISVLNSPIASISPSPEPHRLSSSSSSSSSTMAGRKSSARSPQAEIPLPVTYTPTTHRISKAKKGKRVHACEYPGCNKVFTRAEHRRRHELNHNPEASYRCTHMGCKKTFHRPDLLARHMERHELEAQAERTQWTPQTTPPLGNDSTAISRCMSMDNGTLLAGASQPSHSMSIGSIVAPGIHPDLASNCSLMWNGMELPLQPRPVANSFQSQLPESADDSPFYSSPAETCPSPLSDIAFSMPPHSSSISSISSISSAGTSIMDQYPKTILNADVTSSPLQMPSPLRWDGSDAGMPSAHLVPISLEESLIQPPVQCHYPSPSWSSADCLPYDENVQSLAHFQPMNWKQWTM